MRSLLVGTFNPIGSSFFCLFYHIADKRRQQIPKNDALLWTVLHIHSHWCLAQGHHINGCRGGIAHLILWLWCDLMNQTSTGLPLSNLWATTIHCVSVCLHASSVTLREQHRCLMRACALSFHDRSPGGRYYYRAGGQLSLFFVYVVFGRPQYV